MASFVEIAFGFGLVAVTLPVIVELALLTAASLLPRRKARAAAQAQPVLAVIVPAHNEELLIGRAVRSLRAGSESVRIFVVAHNCSDRTAQSAASAGAEVLVYNDPAAQGKGFALRYGFEAAFSRGAGAVLVMDADSVASGNLIGTVLKAFAEGAEVVQCKYQMNGLEGAARSRLAALALRGFNLIRPRGRERMGLSCGILGNGFAVRRSVFSQVPYEAQSLVEDLEYHIHLVLAGKRVWFLEQASVSAEMPSTSAGEAAQRSRWEGGRAHVARKWLLPLASRVSRGRLRLIEPFLDLAGLPLAYACTLLLMSLALPVAWVRIYSAIALGAVAFHILTAAWAGDDIRDDLRLLCRAPGYILWKLYLLPRLLRDSSSSAAWVRTERAPGVRRP